MRRHAVMLPRMAEAVLSRRVDQPASRVRVSEIFESLQGEGPTAGAPCVFVRLAVCNLRCRWCDTSYSWDYRRFAYQQTVMRSDVKYVAERILASHLDRIVFTGGEPLLQQRAIVAILEQAQDGRVVEVETNGTVRPADPLLERVDQWNVSPKLSSAGDPEHRRIRVPVLTTLRDTGRAWLKLVIDNDSDLAEADALIGALDWPRDRVFLMACSRTRDELRARSRVLFARCLERGVRLSPRLHLEWFDGERGR